MEDKIEGDAMEVKYGETLEWVDLEVNQSDKVELRLGKVVQRRLGRKEKRQLRRQAHGMERAMAKMGLGK